MHEGAVGGTAETALVERICRGDRDAAASLIQRHNRSLWRIARGILRNEADAEDVLQEAYLRAFTSIAEFRGESSLSTWLARIVINEARRRLRRAKPTVELAGTGEGPIGEARESLAPVVPSPEQEAARYQIRRMVEQAVDALPAPFRAVFIMRVVEQMSVEETAAALRIPPATVKTRLHRASQRLRRMLGVEFASALDGAFPFAGARCARLTARVLARLNPATGG
jgi:RNA polymerase sigma-70 factor, ECF subfamily